MPLQSALETGNAIPSIAIRSSDVDWARWPADDYVAENDGWLHPAAVAVIDPHAA